LSFRKGYDSIDAAKLPTDGDFYLGYVDGNWPSYKAIKARFPNKLVIGIATSPFTNDGIIGDGPPDNGTWQQWVSWVVRRRAAGFDPWINTNKSSWPAAQSAFRSANVAQPNWWIAWYNDDPTLLLGSPMKQFSTNDDYDTSSAADYLPGIDPKPTNTIPATAVEEDEVPRYEKTCNPETGRAGISFAEGDCNTFQVTCDKGQIPAGGVWRFVIVLDSGPYVVVENQTAPNGKAVVHIPQEFHGQASGVVAYGPKGLEYELYAQ
jgi:hypothetical protein